MHLSRNAETRRYCGTVTGTSIHHPASKLFDLDAGETVFRIRGRPGRNDFKLRVSLSGSACLAAADGMECLELSWCSDRLLGIGTVIQTHEPVHVTGAVLELACSAASLQTITVQELSVINFSSLTETAETKGCVSDAPPTGHYSRLFLPRATPWPQLYRSEF